MSKSNTLHLIGAASGIAAQDTGCADGPEALKTFGLSKKLYGHGIKSEWAEIIDTGSAKIGDLNAIAKWCQEIAKYTCTFTQDEENFLVLGGDHACAIGTWSGVSKALSDQGPLGLIWVDAHLDAHTFETSESGAVHGMPVASLLGYGDKSLTHILSDTPKIDPKHICLIGIRSYEAGEAALLKNLGVKIYTMEDIKAQSLKTVFEEALTLVSSGTVGFGLSIDLDSIDPADCPGVGSPEAGGIRANDLCRALSIFASEERLCGIEIAEYNPHHDREMKTAELVERLILSIIKGGL